MKTYFVDGIRLHGYVSINEKWKAENIENLCNKLVDEVAICDLANHMDIDCEEIEPDDSAVT